jgi:hypothetical protein
MNTKRITLYLYEDEYSFMQERSKKERLPMNKIFQFWIRDEMKKELPIKYGVNSSPIVSDKPAIEKHKPVFNKMLNRFI